MAPHKRRTKSKAKRKVLKSGEVWVEEDLNELKDNYLPISDVGIKDFSIDSNDDGVMITGKINTLDLEDNDIGTSNPSEAYASLLEINNSLVAMQGDLDDICGELDEILDNLREE
jgi:hypothetical protein